MDYSILIFSIIKIAMLMGIGMWLTHKLSFTEDIRRFLIFVIINIAIPAIILNSFFNVTIDNNLMEQIIIVFIFSLIFNFVGLMLGWIIAKGLGFDAQKARETGFLSIFCNAGLIGIPLCAAVFGAKGAVLAAMFDAGMAFSMWTIGVLMLQGKKVVITFKNLRSMLTAPFIAIIIGLVVTIFEIKPIFLIKDVAGTVAGAASPLAMFYIGMLIMKLIQEKHKISVKLVVVPLSLKLVIFPIAGLLLLSFLPIQLEIKQQLLILMALPALAAASIIMAHNKADENYGVIHTLLTTLSSLVTIPVLVLLGGILF